LYVAAPLLSPLLHPSLSLFPYTTLFRSEQIWAIVVWSSMIVWSGALLSAVRSDYLNFRLARFDLGNMVQAVWSTAHGRPLEVTSDRKSTRLNSSHEWISYAVFCLKKKSK